MSICWISWGILNYYLNSLLRQKFFSRHLLSKWERRIVRFLELSRVGRMMADGTDEESAHATRMDEWVVWETRRGREERGEG